MKTDPIHFIDSSAIKGREAKYEIAQVDAKAVLKSWKLSLFSFEWLTPDGAIRPIKDLPLQEHDRRLKVEESLANHFMMERPVLGIGIQDNVEIGSGRDVFLTLAAKGVQTIEVHIPVSSKKEFKQFLVR